MGCINSRSDRSQAELTLEVLERNLLFRTNSSSDIDLYIRKYSHQGMINTNHWVNIVKNLNLNYTSTEIQDFFSQFGNEEGLVLNQILVLGILNGNDSQETKARLLFEAFDIHDTKILDKEGLRLLYDTIFDGTVVKIRSLVKVVHQKDKESECLVFLDKVGEKRKKFGRWFVKLFLEDQESCSLNRFITCFRDEVAEDWLTPSGFRRALKEFKVKDKEEKSGKEVKE